jgi:polyhydroxybutyrate depolymerase
MQATATTVVPAGKVTPPPSAAGGAGAGATPSDRSEAGSDGPAIREAPTPSAGTSGPSSAALAEAGRGGVTAAAGSSGGQAVAGASGAAGVGITAGSAAPIVCPDTPLPPGETTAKLQHDGMERSFILYVPSSYTGKTPVPLVLDWHGLGSSGSSQKGLSGYKALSDQEGFIVAWPNGTENAWNIGLCCTTSDVDDLGFAKAIVADIQRRACVDPKRIYADGYSMGGGMSFYLACNAAEIFAAVAPSAFDLLAADEEPCKPARPISVIAFRGTSDPIVPYAGGASMPPNGLNVTIHFQGAENTAKTWSALNGCMGAPMAGAGDCQTYSQCKEGTEVTLCTKQGGGHDPGDAKQGWEFMKKHPMP